jgi:hypothetical protein
MTTNWTKAIDFSGGAERMEQVSNLTDYNPLRMANTSSTIAAPSTAGNTVSNGHPWATAIVFQPDGNSSNQHIWNYGEGAGSTDDNIYLRLDSNGNLFFGWGRSGAMNEVVIGSGFNTTNATSQFWGVYIAHNGTRLSGTNATAANLASAFDIRIMHYYGGSWGFSGINGNYADSVGNRSNATNLGRSGSSTGGRMDRQFTGSLTIGGRGSNRNFHGKVASMVVTTLKVNDAMPTDAEIIEMVTDPMGWLDDYKVGNSYRVSTGTANASSFAKNQYGARATQVWLMGDGATDSYSNMIRNQVYTNDQNSTKMNMISMVANDIQTVSIAGLT